MSGGHFNYDQYKIGYIADEVEQLIRYNGSEEKDEWGYNKHSTFEKETIDKFAEGLLVLRMAQIYAQRIDWLVSGDDGEDSFHRRLKNDIKKLQELHFKFLKEIEDATISKI
jgi:hypothetical protein